MYHILFEVIIIIFVEVNNILFSRRILCEVYLHDIKERRVFLWKDTDEND